MSGAGHHVGHRRAERTEEQDRRADALVAAVSGAVALAAVVGGSIYGNVRPSGPGDHLEAEVAAWSSAAVLAVAGVLLTRHGSSVLGRLVARRTIPAAGVAIRIVASVVGYVVVLFTALGLLSVSVSHILTAGAITGVVVGIAAQQSLGNVFAGLVLLLARPFTIGDHVRVRSGSLGGLFDGVVLEMSLTYVTLSTDDGPLKVPNAALLASAVGPYRDRLPVAPTPGDGPTPEVGPPSGEGSTSGPTSSGDGPEAPDARREGSGPAPGAAES
ncbi:MAG: mechanosensitive ion channel [Actinomycetota bacterium]|nr:mechanosensitive ion channel [Actinomycetota bacterium]